MQTEFIKLSKINDLNRNNIDGLVNIARYEAVRKLISDWNETVNKDEPLDPRLDDIDALIQELERFKKEALAAAESVTTARVQRVALGAIPITATEHLRDLIASIADHPKEFGDIEDAETMVTRMATKAEEALAHLP